MADSKIVPISRDQKPKKKRAERDHITRWGGDKILFERGYVPVPERFLELAREIEYPLRPSEALFVIQLMSFKWDAEAPFPKYATIAKRMGIGEQYARKLARQLEGKGHLIRIERKGRSNAFDLSPLFRRLAKAAKAGANEERRGLVV